jgi:hypothetical protein
MQKKKRMEVISKSIDFVNKKKYHALTTDELLKNTLKEAKERGLTTDDSTNVFLKTNLHRPLKTSETNLTRMNIL